MLLIEATYMKYSVLILTLLSIYLSPFSMADEEETKAEQCAQYGAYQDEDGNWQTCSEEDMPSDES